LNSDNNLFVPKYEFFKFSVIISSTEYSVPSVYRHP
jgi:hypothetical protein